MSIVSSMAPSPPGTGALNLSDLRAKVDPRKEWRQMYRQVWRDEALFFYAPNMHGNDMKMLEKRYEPFLDNISSPGRSQLPVHRHDGEMTIVICGAKVAISRAPTRFLADCLGRIIHSRTADTN